jgi:hypothetical protein
MKIETALEKLTAIKGVRAAFVSNSFQEILGRAVPEKYPDQILRHIGAQVHQMFSSGWKLGFSSTEFRLGYAQNAIHVRLFAENKYLVLFTDPRLQAADLRPAVNLAIVVLEKLMRAENTLPFQQERGLRSMAMDAEESLRSVVERDKSFAGDFRRLCFDFFGQLGREVVDDGIEAHMIAIPLFSETHMNCLINYAMNHLPHTAKKTALMQEAKLLYNKKVKELR